MSFCVGVIIFLLVALVLGVWFAFDVGYQKGLRKQLEDKKKT